MKLQTIDPSQAVIPPVGSATNAESAESGIPLISGTADPVNIHDGAHDLYATGTNAAGASSASSNHFDFSVFSTTWAAQAVALATGFDGGHVDIGNVTPNGSSAVADLQVKGNGDAGATVNIYDGSTLLGRTTVGSSGSWSFGVLHFSNGAHDLTATQSSSLGVSVSPSHFHFTVDPIATPDPKLNATASGDSTASDVSTAAAGNETIDLATDPATYFRESAAHIQGSAGSLNTLHLLGDHQILDLTSLTGQTSSAKISGVPAIDLGGHINDLKLSLVDVLNLGEQDLFQSDGHRQMMVSGSNGDTVELSNSPVAGIDEGQWQVEGTLQTGGVTYDVYEHSSAQAELLVQHGIQVALHN